MGYAPAPSPAQKRRSPITALAPFTVHTAQRVRTAYYQDPKGQVLSTELSTDGVCPERDYSTAGRPSFWRSSYRKVCSGQAIPTILGFR